MQPPKNVFSFSLSRLARFFLLMLAVFSTTVALSGQTDIYFKKYELEDQLAEEYVREIIQDRRGWLWMATEGGLVRYDGHQFSIFQHDEEDEKSLGHNMVNALYEDMDGYIWLAHSRGLDRYDPKRNEFFHYDHNINSTTILEDRNGGLWVGTGEGLSRLDRTSGQFQHYLPAPEAKEGSDDNHIRDILEDRQGFLWVATHGGLYCFDPAEGRFTERGRVPAALHNIGILTLHEDQKGVLWIGSGSRGLFRFDPETRELDQLFPDEENKATWRITSLFQDKSGTLWVGTREGLFRYDAETGEFYGNLPNEDGVIFHNNITTITQDREGTYWIGTFGGGLFSYVWREAGVRPILPGFFDDYAADRVNSMHKDQEGRFWLASRKGLNRYDPTTGRLTTFFPNPKNADDPYDFSNMIGRIVEGPDSALWLGGMAGIWRFDRESETFRPYRHDPDDEHSISDGMITAIYVDSQDRLWIGTMEGGLNQYNRETDTFIQVLDKPDAPRFGNAIRSILEDESGKLWLGTNADLMLFDPETRVSETCQGEGGGIAGESGIGAILKSREGNYWFISDYLSLLTSRAPLTFERYGKKEGISKGIRGIQEDHRGRLWLGSRDGFMVFDLRDGSVKTFPTLNGRALGFTDVLFQDTETREIWLGAEAGPLIIHPDSLPYNDYQPPVHITRLAVYDHQNQTGGFRDLPAPWSKTSVTLPYYQNTLTAEFAVLSYKNPAKTQAAYWLEGVNNDWVNVGDKREATFGNLRPGRYTLRVKGANNDGVWNEEGAALQITVLPPGWLTIWAKIGYLLLAAGLVYGVYRYQLQRKLALAEARRLKELDQVKTRLMTNITHEFRTPLTVIQGMAGQTIEQKGNLPPEKHLENARLINRNSAQLLTMVNQMLELRKLESCGLPLRMVQGDVLQYLRYLAESFDSHARNKGVGLHFLADREEWIMDYDPDKLLYIVSNLLSNAVKFTSTGGNVYFRVAGGSSGSEMSSTLILSVQDTGIGIAEAEMPHIFDRFYQADQTATRRGEGTGIGLALTRELVKLLGGEIAVRSQLGKGTTFTVQLPVRREAEEGAVDTTGIADRILGFAGPMQEVDQQSTPLDVLSAAEEDRPLVLLIEDNPDVLRYLSACLEEDYQVLTARDGQTGVNTALDVIPDVIISDVMMPGKDGYEVCDILKNDERTSHIPIILLTAKVDQEARLAGLKSGADAYLAKPFHREELLVRLRQLIELRRKLQEHYGGLFAEEIAGARSSVDVEFLRKVRQAVEENISDPEFGIAELGRTVALSRSQLFRKLKALTGKSATLVIRSIRLQRGRQLLLQGKLNVSEVAYSVGFKDPNYFTRCFQDEFGELPSTVRAN